MQIHIQAINFRLTNDLRELIERRLEFGLGNRGEHIQRIIVHLSDINGPRGGVDKCCHISVILPHLQNVIIEDTETDIFIAIGRAVDRATRTVSRRLERHANRRRTSKSPNPIPMSDDSQAL